MPTKIELTLEQSQQGGSNDVLVSIEGVEEFKKKLNMEILPEPTSNKLLVEAIPLLTESLTPISKDHNSRDKRKEGEDREVAFIEEAYYQNKLQKYYDTRSSRFRVYEGELYKITDASDYSLVQSAKGTSLWYMLPLEPNYHQHGGLHRAKGGDCVLDIEAAVGVIYDGGDIRAYEGVTF
ncbi:hypothetical protein Tco_0003005 [Tanacetum coccineum]